MGILANKYFHEQIHLRNAKFYKSKQLSLPKGFWEPLPCSALEYNLNIFAMEQANSVSHDLRACSSQHLMELLFHEIEREKS